MMRIRIRFLTVSHFLAFRVCRFQTASARQQQGLSLYSISRRRDSSISICTLSIQGTPSSGAAKGVLGGSVPSNINGRGYLALKHIYCNVLSPEV